MKLITNLLCIETFFLVIILVDAANRTAIFNLRDFLLPVDVNENDDKIATLGDRLVSLANLAKSIESKPTSDAKVEPKEQTKSSLSQDEEEEVHVRDLFRNITNQTKRKRMPWKFSKNVPDSVTMSPQLLFDDYGYEFEFTDPRAYMQPENFKNKNNSNTLTTMVNDQNDQDDQEEDDESGEEILEQDEPKPKPERKVAIKNRNNKTIKVNNNNNNNNKDIVSDDEREVEYVHGMDRFFHRTGYGGGYSPEYDDEDDVDWDEHST